MCSFDDLEEEDDDDEEEEEEEDEPGTLRPFSSPLKPIFLDFEPSFFVALLEEEEEEEVEESEIGGGDGDGGGVTSVIGVKNRRTRSSQQLDQSGSDKPKIRGRLGARKTVPRSERSVQNLPMAAVKRCFQRVKLTGTTGRRALGFLGLQRRATGRHVARRSAH